MFSTSRALRRTVAPVLATVMLVLSVAVPMLDRDPSATPVLESHHVASCVMGHDHTICVQASASRAHPTHEVRPPLAEILLAERLGDVANGLHGLATSTGYSPRAPPRA